MRRCMTASFLEYMRAHGQDPAFGAHLWGYLNESKAFDKILVDHVMAPMNPAHGDSELLLNFDRSYI